jgi:hypothetical protein
MKLKKYLPFIFVAALAASCQEVIDVELNDKDAAIVIEANITDQPGPYTVTVTRSVNFSDPNVFPGVSGAFVTMADDAGNMDTLIETSAGVYVSNSFQGVTGRTYTVRVVADGVTYTASSFMPTLITLDSLVLEESGGFGGSQYYIIPQWQDPVGTGNYYRCIEYVNGERVGSFLYDDAFSDGLVNGQPLLNFETQLESGDTVRVVMQCIDPDVYLYFYSMDLTANNSTAAPANPETNFDNDALGYFNACAVSERTVVIP